ncbi:DUF1983 domain-containing protein [Tritonibacter mobilis]|uniref:DUF1983 domain-containing protein n=2 Tax=Tritonibacter mobilis TaxID=379347 RepID=UPI000B20F351|nr:DUF1983 domain-containing protein [Tritonibacter mobilis]GLP85579.1 hypothetical protein GCM10007921_11390 [Tritonibacter mobilis]
MQRPQRNTTAHSHLVNWRGGAADRPWTPDHILTGTCYAVLYFYRRDHLYPSGVPRYAFELDGPPLYDIRKDSTVGGNGSHRFNDPASWDQTANPLVIAYNVLRGIALPSGDIWGGGFPAEDLPYTEWAEAMDACDIGIEGVGRAQFEAGFEVKFEEAPADFLEELFSAANAQIVETGGYWYPIVGSATAASATISDDDVLISQAWQHDPFPGLENTFNAVTTTYTSPASLWEASTLETIVKDEWVAEDGRQKLFELNLPMVYIAEQARQLTDALLRENRRFRTHRLPLPGEYARLRPLQNVHLSLQDYGYDAKTFRITEAAYDLQTLNVSLSLRETDPTDFDPDPALELPETPHPTGPIPVTDAGVVGLAVAGETITAADGKAHAPAIRIVWDGRLSDTCTGLTFQIRVQGRPEAEADTVSTTNVAGGNYRHHPVQPNADYEVRGKAIAPTRQTKWSGWLPVTTPDVRINPGALDDDVWDAVGDEAASVAAALDDDLVINEIQPLKREVDLRTAEQRTVSEAVAMIGDQVLWVTTQLSEVDGKFADAGIVTDPETGKVRIYALEQEAERISEAEIRLSAAEASIALSATQAWVRGQITEALLDPSQLPLVEDLQLQVNQVEVELDAINGTLKETATQTVVDGLITRLSTAETELDAAQQAISLKAEQTQLETLQGRVQTAEQVLSAFDGPQLTQTVADTRYLLAADEEAAEQTLASLLQAHADGERIRQDIAYATEDLRAKVTEDREAFAIRSVQIGASIDNAMALIEQESLARASQGEALAASLNTLTTTVGENTATVQTLSESVDGISGRHMLRVNVNGVATGMVIAAEAGDDGAVSSSVAFAADSFTISAPDGSSLTVPFSVFTVGRTIDEIYYPPGVYMEDIYVRRAIIGRADIHTANIAEGAITNNFAAFAGSDFYLSSSYQEVLAIDNVECSGNTMSLQANIQVDGASAIEIEVRVNGAPQRVFTVSAGIFMQQQSYPVGFTARGSTYVGEGGGWVNISVNGTASAHIVPTPIFYADLKTIMMTVTPGEGTHRVSLHARLKAGSMSASAHVFNRFLQVEETKR